MFIFSKLKSMGEVDVYQILLAANSLDDAEDRFGQAFIFSTHEVRYHELGWVLLHDVGESHETDVYIGCKNLSESEMSIFWEELTMFIGKDIGCSGAEPEPGWFLNEEFRDYHDMAIARRNQQSQQKSD